jgi:hypothetical protein
MAPIVWFSKKQATTETSVFGAEFVAMKQGMECLQGLRYKLRMMGVAILGPSYIYGDNMSVIHNTQRPESTMLKRSQILSVTTLYAKLLPWESVSLAMFLRTITLRTFVRRLYPEAANVTTWLVYSSMI